jgi:putative Mg2+ transporter-C (MgtC) family protein
MFSDFSGHVDLVVRLLLAGLLGGLLGLERQIHGHWAGLRTHMNVAIGAATFTVLGLCISSPNSMADTTRVIQGIAAGIGFLGAGTILKLSDQLEVKGLTTASAIWLAAAVGVGAGLAEYSVATAATLITLVILAALRPLERLFGWDDGTHGEHKDPE